MRVTVDAVTAVALACGGLVYARGVRTAWQRSGTGAVFRPWQVGAYALGLTTLATALVSPVATAALARFSVHMTQHELLMLVGAPLIVMGRPLLAVLWALPPARRPKVVEACHTQWVTAAWRWLTAPLVVFLLHGLALWIWHVPSLFEWALHDEWVHAGQHLAFTATAALFWWGMLHGAYGRAGYGIGALYVFLTAMHSTLLGALLTVAPSTVYPSYRGVGDSLGDQQLAGLLMWVPSGVVFLLMGLALVAAWMGEAERRARVGVVDRAMADPERRGVTPH